MIRGLMAAAIFAGLGLVWFEVILRYVDQMFWRVFLASPVLSFLGSAFAIAGIVAILAFAIAFYFSKVDISIAQTAFLSVFFVISLHIANWLENQFSTLTDPEGRTFGGSWVDMMTTLMVIGATFAVTYTVRYFKGRSEARQGPPIYTH